MAGAGRMVSRVCYPVPTIPAQGNAYSSKNSTTLLRTTAWPRHSDDDQFYSVFGKMSWRDFTLEGAYVSGKKAFPRALLARCSMTRAIVPSIAWPTSTCNMHTHSLHNGRF